MNEQLREEILLKNEVFHGRVFDVRVDEVRLPDGTSAGRELVVHPGGVCVAALTDDGCVLTVKQFRYGAQRVLLELPAGKLEPGEDPDAAVRRELSEETGATADVWYSLGKMYPTPAYCGEVIHMYAAEGLHFGQAHPDTGEFLTQERIPLEELYRRVLAGEISDAKTMVMILKLCAGRFGK